MRSVGYCSCTVCMYVYMYVCKYVCVYVCVCVHSYLPPHKLESQTRDTTDSAQYRDRFKFSDFPKNSLFKSYGVICLPGAAPAS